MKIDISKRLILNTVCFSILFALLVRCDFKRGSPTMTYKDCAEVLSSSDSLKCLICSSELNSVKLFLEKKGPDELWFIASKYGNSEMLGYLLTIGYNIDLLDKSGLNGLNYSSRYTNSEATSFLINNGIDKSDILSPFMSLSLNNKGLNEKFQKTLDILINHNLHLSDNGNLLIDLTKSNAAHIVDELLLNGLDVNKKDAFGWSALHHASMQGRLETAKILIKHNCEKQSKTLQERYFETNSGFEIYEKELTPYDVALKSKGSKAILKLLKN